MFRWSTFRWSKGRRLPKGRLVHARDMNFVRSIDLLNIGHILIPALLLLDSFALQWVGLLAVTAISFLFFVFSLIYTYLPICSKRKNTKIATSKKIILRGVSAPNYPAKDRKIGGVEGEPILRNDRFLKNSIDRTKFVPSTCTRWPLANRRPFDQRKQYQQTNK